MYSRLQKVTEKVIMDRQASAQVLHFLGAGRRLFLFLYLGLACWLVGIALLDCSVSLVAFTSICTLIRMRGVLPYKDAWGAQCASLNPNCLLRSSDCDEVPGCSLRPLRLCFGNVSLLALGL